MAFYDRLYLRMPRDRMRARLSLSTNHIRLEFYVRLAPHQAKVKLSAASERRTRRSTFALAPLQGTES